ncbi:hypothetical protein [Streptomyces diastatochromogenes]|uniref:hypothetical protein n=1 Tax=Streptomyces diastatochromogenes TaxID=42236 RepID=UPI00142D3FED|nr:hypothetical protein [Streptomyces diastatochromogenes]MCZ0984517.1 hypothetical protein [Streptomyces diastatochromogenes]
MCITDAEETGTPPEGDGIRYLSEHRQPEPAEPLALPSDSHRGSKHPETVHPAGSTLQG